MSAGIVNGLILSAGLSGRMGRFKPLIAFEGRYFLEHIILKLNSVCDSVYIVTGHKSEEVKSNLEKKLASKIKSKTHWVFNPDYEKGMLTSLQTGIRNMGHSNWLLYHFTDQPDIPQQFYQQFAAQIDANYDWIQPFHKGQPGHPVLISEKLFPAILSLKENQSLRDLKDKHVKKWDCTYFQIRNDYNTQDQLKKLSVSGN